MFCVVPKNISEDKLDKISYYILYENDKYYFLPRFSKKYLKYSQIKTWYDRNFNYSKIEPFNFYSKLLPRQLNLLNQIKSNLNNKYFSGIIQARPGFGKTVFGIYLISKLLFKTVIFVDSDMLYKQQFNEILKHTSLKNDDIGLIKESVFDVENKRIIFTTPQTMLSKFKNENTRRDYYLKIKELGVNLILQDESHVLSRKQASSFLFFDTMNIIGFTATPYFSGKQRVFIQTIFDKIIGKYNRYKIKPQIYFVNQCSNITDKKQIRRLYATYHNNYIMFLQIYNKLIYEDTNQYDIIIKIISDEIKEENNKIIVIVNTKKQMLKLSEKLERLNIEHKRLYSKENKIDKKKDRVLIAVYKYASKAFDNKYLNRAIIPVLISGRKSLAQTIGRILRDADGKTDAKVYIFKDDNYKLKGIHSNIYKIQKKILKLEYDNIEIKNIN